MLALVSKRIGTRTGVQVSACTPFFIKTLSIQVGIFMKFIHFRYHTRYLMLVMLIVAFGLSACGGGSTFPAKRDVGNDSNNEQDSGVIVDSDTGTTGDSGNTDEENDENNPCRQTTADDAAKFAKDYAAALCTKMLSCNRNSSVTMLALFGGWVDQDSCVTGILAQHMSADQARAAVDNNTMKLDSCAATSCLAQIGDLDCSDADSPAIENYVQGISSCYDALVGRVKTGKPCTINGQCGDQEFCQPDDKTDVCGGTCGDVGLTLSGQCGDIVCRGDQFCTPENNVCVSKYANGKACEADYECAYDSECADNVCTTITAGLESGAACDSMNALCKIGLMCLSEICTVPGAQGDACQYAGCGPGLFCTEAGKCVTRGAAGDSCEDDSQCKSLSCVEGACTNPNALCN